MSTRVADRFAGLRLPRIPRWLDIGIWLLLTLLCARLIALPQARALGHGDEIAAAAGQWLVLDGLAKDAAINLKVPLAGSAGLSAPRAALDRPTVEYLKGVGLLTSTDPGPLTWSASATSAGEASLIATLAPLTPDARISLATAGAGRELRMRVDRGALAVSVRLDSDDDTSARGLIDAPVGGGAHPYAPWQPLTFVLDPRGQAALTFASAGKADIWLQPAGADEKPLPLISLDTEGDIGTLTRTCGGRAGDIMFWSILFQPRVTPLPARVRCQSGYMTVDGLALSADGIIATPGGSAYRPGELPLVSSLKANDALKVLIVPLIAYPGGRLMGLIKVGKKSSVDQKATAKS